jgi:hypothetical protein
MTASMLHVSRFLQAEHQVMTMTASMLHVTNLTPGGEWGVTTLPAVVLPRRREAEVHGGALRHRRHGLHVQVHLRAAAQVDPFESKL